MCKFLFSTGLLTNIFDETAEHDDEYEVAMGSAAAQVQVFSNTYSPIRGGTFVELPEWVSAKNNKDMCMLNVKNRDEKYFMWSILSAIHPATRNRERVSHYKPFADELDFTGISLPVSIDDIPCFEKQNPSIVISAGRVQQQPLGRCCIIAFPYELHPGLPSPAGWTCPCWS